MVADGSAAHRTRTSVGSPVAASSGTVSGVATSDVYEPTPPRPPRLDRRAHRRGRRLRQRWERLERHRVARHDRNGSRRLPRLAQLRHAAGPRGVRPSDRTRRRGDRVQRTQRFHDAGVCVPAAAGGDHLRRRSGVHHRSADRDLSGSGAAQHPGGNDHRGSGAAAALDRRHRRAVRRHRLHRGVDGRRRLDGDGHDERRWRDRGSTRRMPSVSTSPASRCRPSGPRCANSPPNSRTSRAPSGPTNSVRSTPSCR